MDFHQMVCSFILWRTGLGLFVGKFHLFLIELSAHDRSIFSFPDDNFSKCQWIFTKFGLKKKKKKKKKMKLAILLSNICKQLSAIQ